MGLMKAEKIVYVKSTIDNAGNVLCEKTFSELCEIFDSGFFPVLCINNHTGKIYLYPQDYTQNVHIIFSNVSIGIPGYESVLSVAVLSSSVIAVQCGLNTSASFMAVISKTESGYECDRSYSDFSTFCVDKGYTPLVQLKKDDPYNSYIPLVFGGREYESGLDTFCFYYNNFITMKRFVFKIGDDGVTMTESTIS